MYSLYDRVLGCLVTAGMGDGIGAPTEAMSRQEILEKYGRITGFVDGSTNLAVSYTHLNSRVTNGGGMKSGMMGLFNPGDLDAAIDDTITLCGLTHDNTIALSAACAIAAATAKAFCPGVSYLDLIEAGIYGAQEGYARSLEHFRPVAASSISKRIALAAEIGLAHQDDLAAAMEEIADVIGCGLFAHESIPAAFGYIAAARGQVMDSLYMAINAGDDTDTVACMTGFIAGAYCSSRDLSPRYLALIDEVNHFDLRDMALQIDAIAGNTPET